MIQREDFWDTIAKNVAVFREDVVEMRKGSIVLETGSEVPTDAHFCGTGWDPNYPFLTNGRMVAPGLPHAVEDDLHTAARWKMLLEAADKQVIARFPQLAEPPLHFERPRNITSTRLYRGMVPLCDKPIVFLGDVYLSNAFCTAEAQAIWATAYLDGNYQVPPQAEAEKDIAYMAAFSNRRYPSHGQRGTYFHVDLIGYTDRLLQDVGLV
ncbi:MAG: hypothetical protein LQ346_000908 [Caloplaca aetnensis]|nr:MAG: hypothetical protein LQ346_000908 [Caloplaca aetnensis]